jgi:Flp pilus assembly protein TadG
MAQAVGNRRTRRSLRERGAELIEFALILPLILVLIMGIFDFGLAFQRYEVITNAAREGARLGTLQGGYLDADIQGRVNDYCVAAGLPGGCPLANVAVNRAATITVGSNVQAAVQVTVSYPHSFAFLGPVMRLISGGTFGSVNLRATSTMRCEAGCT